MPRPAKANGAKKPSRASARKRKSEALDTDQEVEAETVSNADEDIVLIAKRVAARAQRQQQKLRKDQQTAFSKKIESINAGISGMFGDHDRTRLIEDKLLRLRGFVSRRDELDRILVQHTLDLNKLISGAQRSLNIAIQSRSTELEDLRKRLRGNVDIEDGGNPVSH